MAKSVTFGDLSFKTKGMAETFLKEMMLKYELGDQVDEADSNILSLLLARHPEAAEKIGPGIETFHVRTADFGTRCFWVTRVDGTSVKFSARSCL